MAAIFDRKRPQDWWPTPPAGLELTMVDIDGEQLAVLSHPVGGGLAGAKLTKAESEVATAVSEGLSNRDVARLRGTSERTVAKQIAATFRKLGISSRRQLLARTRGGEAE